MYLQKIHIENVRSFSSLTWELPNGAKWPGWHVILGDNGSGKSTLLRSIAMAFINAQELGGLRQSWDEWLRFGCDEGLIGTTVEQIEEDGEKYSSSFRLRFSKQLNGEVWLTVNEDFSRRHDWFSASYGPFRRFAGGDSEPRKPSATKLEVARHLSLFGESVALTEAISWLQTLKFKKLERDADGDLLDPILVFINQPGFLSQSVHVADVTSNGVELVDANGFTVPMQDISDGYRSILSMTFDLIRQMSLAFGAERIFSTDQTKIICSGVVLIDEIDAHLHPTWQRTIGLWFRTHFPNIQFIVSTHSPLICQAAEVGSVFRLPLPGADPEEDQGEMLSGMALNRLLYGNVLDAYSTGAFGDGGEPSKRGQAKLERLAKLNIKELTESLTEGEKAEQDELRAILPTEASTTQSS